MHYCMGRWSCHGPVRPSPPRRVDLLPHVQPCHPHLGTQHAAGRAAWGCTTPGRPARMLVRATEPLVVDSKVSDTVDTGTQAEQTNEQFCWTKHWYPVASLLELDPSRPTQITLLGEDYVLWRDGSGAWKAFADRCPHRLAPLSEGRVEKDGTLLCAYHAWRFDGSGACTAIPQAQDAEHELQARQNPRACATAFPTRVEQGLVWVWPEAGAEAAREASGHTCVAVQAGRATEGNGTQGSVAQPWHIHDFPYGVLYFLENALDPAHAVVSHHKIAGNRYTDPKHLDIQTVQSLSRDQGFACRVPYGRKGLSSTTQYKPPNAVITTVDFPKGAKLMLDMHVTPTRPGHCRVVSRQVFVRAQDGRYPTVAAFLTARVLPTWLVHVLGYAFLRQDLMLQHWQEQTAKQSSFRGLRATERYFMPTTADKMVVLVHKWFDLYSPQGIPYKGEFEGVSVPPSIRQRDQLFDTWSAHTSHCKVCQDGLASLKKARVAAWVVCALAAVQVAVTSAASAASNAATTHTVAHLILPPVAAWLWAGLAVAAAVVAKGLQSLVCMFYSQPFSHADN